MDKTWRVEYDPEFDRHEFWMSFPEKTAFPIGDEDGVGASYIWYANAVAFAIKRSNHMPYTYRVVNTVTGVVRPYVKGGRVVEVKEREDVSENIQPARPRDLRYRVEYRGEMTDYSLFSRYQTYPHGVGERGEGASFRHLENARAFALTRSKTKTNIYRVVDLDLHVVIGEYKKGEPLGHELKQTSRKGSTMNTAPTKPLVVKKDTAIEKVQAEIDRLRDEHSAAQAALAAENEAKFAKIAALLQNPWYVVKLFEAVIGVLSQYDNAEAVMSVLKGNYGSIPGTVPFEAPEDAAKMLSVLQAIENETIEITPEHNLYNFL